MAVSLTNWLPSNCCADAMGLGGGAAATPLRRVGWGGGGGGYEVWEQVWRGDGAYGGGRV